MAKNSAGAVVGAESGPMNVKAKMAAQVIDGGNGNKKKLKLNKKNYFKRFAYLILMFFSH
jgi:hypothetical protein